MSMPLTRRPGVTVMSMPFLRLPEQFMGQAQAGGPDRTHLTDTVRDRGPAAGAAGGQPS